MCICMCIYLHTCVCVHVCVCVHTRTACTYLFVRMCVCTYLCTYTCTYIYTYMYKYIHARTRCHEHSAATPRPRACPHHLQTLQPLQHLPNHQTLQSLRRRHLLPPSCSQTPTLWHSSTPLARTCRSAGIARLCGLYVRFYGVYVCMCVCIYVYMYR